MDFQISRRTLNYALWLLKIHDEIPTTTGSVNTLCLAYSCVITCEGTKQTVTHLCFFFLCWQKNVFPDSTKSCGPYKPRRAEILRCSSRHASRGSHDTIGRIHLLLNAKDHWGAFCLINLSSSSCLIL